MTPAQKDLGTTQVKRLVPMAHVADVEASVAFYGLLGFTPRNVLRDADGKAYWAMTASGSAEIMFARASGPIDAGVQAVLFYMYSPDLRGLRAHLLASGLRDGAATDPGGDRRVTFPITHPPYMPAGELRIHDPDGYVVLVGQLG
jgi:catechol 2,3-dioxygenase-like lactoylglutathione lyase family enzyme